MKHMHCAAPQLLAEAPGDAETSEVLLVEHGHRDPASAKFLGEAPFREEDGHQLQLSEVGEPGEQMRYLDLGARPQVALEEVGNPHGSAPSQCAAYRHSVPLHPRFRSPHAPVAPRESASSSGPRSSTPST